MVIDGGLEPGYRSTLANQNRLLRESCYSLNSQVRQSKIAAIEDLRFRIYYEYKGASLCQNTSSSQHSSGASVLRTWTPNNPNHLLGAEGRSGQSDVGVPVIRGDHQTIVAGTITEITSPGVRQWHVHNESVIGKDGLGNIAFRIYNRLNQDGRVFHTVAALKDLAEGSLSLSGVKVISVSQFVEDSGNNPNVTDRYTYP